jgi:class 3 adenylate cyclase
MRRKLTVIVASDVAGYSRLVAAAEEETIRRLREASTIFSDLVTKYHGRVFKTAGDAILADFESAVDATRCAIDIQDANNAQNAGIAEDMRLLFRIGIAVGDVLVAEDGDLLGDGVNIAARLEGLATPGGICISEEVRAHVSSKIALNVVDLGDQNLRNIPRPVRAFKLVPRGESAQNRSIPAHRLARRRSVAWIVSVAAVAAVLGAALLIWQRQGGPYGPSATDQPFDAASVPLVDDRVRSALSSYGQRPDYKAIAISRQGWGDASGVADIETAKLEAIDRCRRRDQKGYCRLYAAGDKVVWAKSTLPLPLPADIHAEPLDTPITTADLALIKLAVPRLQEDYVNAADHKALAVGAAAIWHVTSRASRAEAVRLAVERCSDFAQMACLLFSVDGFLVVRIPRAHRITRLFTLAGATEIADAEKQRIAQTYREGDWRALAKGHSGRWYAVSRLESEAAAADKSLEACHQAEPECSLHAIGNFLVDDKR